MATIGKGTTFGFCTTSNGSFTDIGNLVDVDLPSLKADAVETTNMASANGTTTPGYDMPQQVNFSVQYDPTGYAALVGERRTDNYWKITLPDTATLVWPGWLNTVSGPAQMKDVIVNKGMIESQGDATFAAPV